MSNTLASRRGMPNPVRPLHTGESCGAAPPPQQAPASAVNPTRTHSKTWSPPADSRRSGPARRLGPRIRSHNKDPTAI